MGGRVEGEEVGGVSHLNGNNQPLAARRVAAKRYVGYGRDLSSVAGKPAQRLAPPLRQNSTQVYTVGGAGPGPLPPPLVVSQLPADADWPSLRTPETGPSVYPGRIRPWPIDQDI